MTWREYKRSDPVVAAGSAFVSLRPSGIGFSAGFVTQADISQATRVSLLVDEARKRLGFRFHDDEENPDAYALTFDGGRSGRAKWMQSRLIYAQYPWLAAAAKGSARARRFEPEWDERAKVWFLDLSAIGPRK